VNIQEYISSGIIETYVLDLCDEKEKAEFERICGKYPEIKSAREAFEQQLEDHAIAHAVHPPKHLKSRIFAHIEIESEKKEGIRHHHGEISNIHPRINWLRYFSAAAMILLFVSTTLNFYFFARLRSQQEKMNAVVIKEQELLEKETLLNSRLNDLNKPGSATPGPEITEIELRPVSGKTDHVTATIFRSNGWDDLMLLFHDIPPAARGTWYQLWGIVSGKPVNAGRFTISENDALIRLKNIAADSFAITISRPGGLNPSSQDQLYITGKKKR
jgi:hypothetical protein